MTTPQVLGERYEIGGVLGRGGMAEVHRGRDLRLGREVAVKVLRHDLARDPSFQVRFRREAQAAASLNHPAIVAVYDTGEDRTPTGATPYIVMEYVEGDTLRDVLRREGPLDPDRAMSLSADICGALDFSHRNGIVHRDVKPGNVMITPQGTVKVMDFGIARAVSDSAATMTSTAAVIGTAQYLSPEQARGESVDARSDVYSMGCLLFELITGAPPFTGDSPVAVAYQHVREDPRLPSSIHPRIPPELDAIVLKAMSKNPANRYQSAAEMRSDLLRALAGQRVEATPVMGDEEKTTILAATPGGYGYGNDDWDDDEAAAKRRKRKIIAIVAAVALLLIGGAIAIAVAMSGADPKTVTVAKVNVPALVNKTVEEARTLLTDAKLEVGDITNQETSDSTQVGKVLESTPASGAEVDEGTQVALVVGVAPDTVTVPNVVDLDEERARATLDQSGFTSVSVDRIDSTRPAGQVIAVEPGEGTPVAPGTAITLTVSDGDDAIPDVRGLSEADARQRLAEAGFNIVRTESAASADVPAGQAIGTQPGANSQAGASDQIVLQISSGAADITVPNVRGLTEAQARQRLQGAGFSKITTQPTENDGSVADGQVLNTNPEPGESAAPDTQIVLLIAQPPAAN
jgi:beta-lactam-binding protein with PASTA domain/tRNA A-37 threonylcarbamoyl transferase component Bud32